MALLIIAREIDLSVASILAFASVVLGVLIRAHVPLVAAIPSVLRAGAAAGSAQRSAGHRSESAFAARYPGHHGLISRDRLHHTGNSFCERAARGIN